MLSYEFDSEYYIWSLRTMLDLSDNSSLLDLKSKPGMSFVEFKKMKGLNCKYMLLQFCHLPKIIIK